MTDPVEDFWAARDAHKKRVAAKLREVEAEILDGVNTLNLYRDGLTGLLSTVQTNTVHLANELDPPPAPAPVEPPVEPQE